MPLQKSYKDGLKSLQKKMIKKCGNHWKDSRKTKKKIKKDWKWWDKVSVSSIKEKNEFWNKINKG
jgi:hypothetical protein